MKFKKLFLKSIVFTASAMLPGALLSSDAVVKPDVPTSKKVCVTEIFKPVTIKVDTVYVTDEFWDAGMPGIAGGSYVFSSHNIKVTYAVPKSLRPRIIEWCELQNSFQVLTTAHELEHARKVLLVKCNQNYSPLVRGRLAAMNEIMAPGAEIVAAADYHMKHGDRLHPLPSSAYVVDSLIQKRMKEEYPFYGRVNYSDSIIADLVLSYASKKFFSATKNGSYKYTIKNAIDAPYAMSVTPNAECDFIACLRFAPQIDDWTALFTYKGPYRMGSADIWNSASEKCRRRTLNMVDSLINEINPAAKYMIVPPNAKSR